MCGIWGFVGKEEMISVDDAWTGLCSLTDRGPDDWGVYIDGEGKVTDERGLPDGEREVVLGNRRLSILDLSAAGNQPMGTEEGFWIVYNGEVYNYREIREELRDRGYEFTSDSDTEVVLRTYEEFGEGCVKRFRGMFAFAVYDAGSGRLFAARDRFGIKPFYYDPNDDRLAFASEVTSLLESGVSQPRLDSKSVDGFLALGYVPGSRTIVEGVESLPPGSRLTYDRETGECEVERYWTPTFGEGTPATAEHVRELLEESVELRLRSDVPVGAFLSGGLDSSTIVALMREVDPDHGDLHTFSIGFDHEAYSETEFAETVAEAFGTEHTSRTVTASDVRSELDDIVDAMDQPTVNGVNTYFVSKATVDAGLKVALSGLGSDELLSGYPTFEEVPRRYHAAKWLYVVPSPIRQVIAEGIERIGSLLPGAPTGKVADAIRSDAPFGAAYLSSRGLFTDRQRRALLGGRSEVAWDAVIEQEVEATLDRSGVEDAVSATELTWYMHNQLLRDTDVMSMAHSLEVRVPFLDSALAEYVMATNPTSKQRDEKNLLKDAVGDVVPLEIIERRKSGFTFPFADWLRDDFGPVVDRALDDDILRRASVDPNAATAVEERFYEGDIHWSRLWALVVLSLWVERHLA